MQRLIEIHKQLPNIHLVMHGSSSVPKELQDIINQYGGKLKPTWGVPVEEIQLGIKNGVRKINVDTDNRLAITGAIRKVFIGEARGVRSARLHEAGARSHEEGGGAAHDAVRAGRALQGLRSHPALRDGCEVQERGRRRLGSECPRGVGALRGQVA